MDPNAITTVTGPFTSDPGGLQLVLTGLGGLLIGTLVPKAKIIVNLIGCLFGGSKNKESK